MTHRSAIEKLDDNFILLLQAHDYEPGAYAGNTHANAPAKVAAD